MRKMRYVLVILCLLFCSVTSANAQVSVGIGIGLPNVSIGINLPLFPELVPVPGYPVYYAPQVDSNYFFYDGMYWVFMDGNWYGSDWYNGPWVLVEPDAVPLFILRVPVRYYRVPPPFFRGWRADAPPMWGRHWGRGWEEHHRGWDRWNRSAVPARAPLPVYQRQYTGDRYPRRVEQQQRLRSEHYRYQPHNEAIRQHYREQRGPAPLQRERRDGAPGRGQGPREYQRPAPLPQGGPAGPRPEPMRRGGEQFQRQAPMQAVPQQRGPAVREQKRQPEGFQRGQQPPRPQGQMQRAPAKVAPQQAPRGGHGEGEKRGEERGPR